MSRNVGMSSATSFPEQARTLGALLRAPYRLLSERVYTCLAEKGFKEIRPAHSAVFRHISPSGSRLTTLADEAGLTKQSMAYLVDHLCKHKYLCVAPDPDDGRARLVRLTARGRALIDALLAASTAVERDVAKVMGKEQIESLRQCLTALQTALLGNAKADN